MYAYAKTDQSAAMEEFVGGTNTANVQAVGDRLYDEKNFKAAKVEPAGMKTLGILRTSQEELGRLKRPASVFEVVTARDVDVALLF